MIAGSVCIGMYIAYYMKLRVDELHELQRVIGYIEGELRYNHSLLYEAINLCGKKADKIFLNWLSFLEKNLMADMAGEKEVNDIWNESMDILKETSHLKNDDIELIRGFGQAFGFLDISAQQNAIALEKERLHIRILELSESLKSRMRLAFAMSALGGICLVIMLI